MPTRRLLIIDPQNDFCDIPADFATELRGHTPALPVPGAYRDMQRLQSLIDTCGTAFDSITITLDSHPYLAVERTTFWTDGQDSEVPAFSEITLASFDAGMFVPRHASYAAEVREMLATLDAAGKSLIVWPVHCVTGTWGHGILDGLNGALSRWELAVGQQVRKVLKGEYPLAEHYGVFEAETPLKFVPSTRFNGELADYLTFDRDKKVELFVAGEALSHCVASSIEQLIRFRKGDATGIVLLLDCMSPVAGFAKAGQAFLERAVAAGATLMTSADATRLLNN